MPKIDFNVAAGTQHGLMLRGRAGGEKRGNQNDQRAERGLGSHGSTEPPVRQRSRRIAQPLNQHEAIDAGQQQEQQNTPDFASAIRPYAVPSNL